MGDPCMDPIAELSDERKEPPNSTPDGGATSSQACRYGSLPKLPLHPTAPLHTSTDQTVSGAAGKHRMLRGDIVRALIQRERVRIDCKAHTNSISQINADGALRESCGPCTPAVLVKMERLQILESALARSNQNLAELDDMLTGTGKHTWDPSAIRSPTGKHKVPTYVYQMLHYLALRNVQRSRVMQAQTGAAKDFSYRQWRNLLYKTLRARIFRYLKHKAATLAKAELPMEQHFVSLVESQHSLWNMTPEHLKDHSVDEMHSVEQEWKNCWTTSSINQMDGLETGAHHHVTASYKSETKCI